MSIIKKFYFVEFDRDLNFDADGDRNHDFVRLGRIKGQLYLKNVLKVLTQWLQIIYLTAPFIEKLNDSQ